MCAGCERIRPPRHPTPPVASCPGWKTQRTSPRVFETMGMAHRAPGVLLWTGHTDKGRTYEHLLVCCLGLHAVLALNGLHIAHNHAWWLVICAHGDSFLVHLYKSLVVINLIRSRSMRVLGQRSRQMASIEAMLSVHSIHSVSRCLKSQGRCPVLQQHMQYMR